MKIKYLRSRVQLILHNNFKIPQLLQNLSNKEFLQKIIDLLLQQSNYNKII